MSQDFPHIKELGLGVYYRHAFTAEGDHYVRAADLEALLAKGVRVYGDPNIMGQVWSDRNSLNLDTHTALLVGIEPIKRDSAEDVLRDMIEQWDGLNGYSRLQELLERAKRVVGKSE